MLNRIVISGRLTSYPELKTSTSGTSLCSFDIANETGFGDKKKTQFIRICTAGKTAENVVRFCRKGGEVGIDGRLYIREYETKDGRKAKATEVWADNVQFFSQPKAEDKADVKAEDVKTQDVYTSNLFEDAMETDLPF